MNSPSPFRASIFSGATVNSPKYFAGVRQLRQLMPQRSPRLQLSQGSAAGEAEDGERCKEEQYARRF
jgi:hypothetical protein